MNFRVSLGSRNRFFRCLWTKQRIFFWLSYNFFLDTRKVICLSHLSRSVSWSGSGVTRGLFSAWLSSSHDGQLHHGLVQSMSCWLILIQLFIERWTSQKNREVHSLPQIPHTLEHEERRGACGSSSSITTNFRVSLGSRHRFFRCLWTKWRIFVLSHNFFLDTWKAICLFPLVPICYAEWKWCYAGVVLGLVELQARRTTSSLHCPEYVVVVDADSAFYRGLQHVQRRTSSRSSIFAL